jgi:alanyl-tRNA synthetase
LSSHASTSRLYYDDAYLREFRARVVEANGDRIYLDRTAFYPSSGGQPSDSGRIGGLLVSEVVDEGDRVAHLVAGRIETREVDCAIDWRRRFDHMQQHTGQHLLSAVFAELFQIDTISFHLGSDVSTIDLAIPSLDPLKIVEAERRANDVVQENRPVRVGYEEADAAAGLRKASSRSGTLRIVTIENLDRSACGGTHVRATGEIGCILLRGVERIRGNVRLEFLCGMRAAVRARADFDGLSSIARLFSSAPGDAPALVSAQMERLEESERARRRLAAEAAQARGARLYAETGPDDKGMRILVRRIRSGSIDEEIRSEAQGFIAHAAGVYIALSEESVLVGASSDSGVHAGNVVKAAVAQLGGRGGGTPQLAQGSITAGVPSDDVIRTIRSELGK